MTEEMLEVRAALNPETNDPIYGDCILAVGDGSVKVEFKAGRAVVKRSVVEQYLLNNGGIEVPALGIYRSRISSGAVTQSEQSVTAEGPAAGEKSIDDMTADELIAHAGRLQQLIEAKVGNNPPADEQPEPPPAADADPPEETEKQRNLRLAREHLEEEGEEVPDVEEPGADPAPAAVRVVPAGFDDMTGDGEPRCLAKTAAGKQCQNAAKDGGAACQLEAHAKQLAG